eukprot:GILI01044726.1.p1 GENE.GILI01044726.1~~GILI01044726.1.p1  ORF type:complete len:122 (-),score=20.45 GILI01044726.1:223-561(-)
MKTKTTNILERCCIGLPRHSTMQLRTLRFSSPKGLNLTQRQRPLVKADNGWSPLHTAAAEAKTEAVKMLLSLGADRNAVCKAGKTPLEVHLAGRPRRLLSKEEADEIVSLLS